MIVISVKTLKFLFPISLVFQLLLSVVVKAPLPLFSLPFLLLVFTIFLLLLQGNVMVLLLDKLFTPVLVPSLFLTKGDLGPKVLLLAIVNVFSFKKLLFLAFHLLLTLIVIIDVLSELFIVILGIILQTFVLHFSLLK